ncbi:MAG TPA: MFS transporter [Opitutales bacterium]|nr:MFS transporter [Opitutales bacterium]
MRGKKGGLFQALGYSSFRWFFFGQILSMTGLWMQQVALGWIIYEMTESAFLLGAIGAVTLLPGFFLVPFAGGLADVLDRRRMLIATQSIMAVLAALLAVLIGTGAAEVWHIFALAFGIGSLHGIDISVRQSIVAQLVDPEVLTNAVALHSITFNLARLAGPSAAGLLLALGLPALCFGFQAFGCVAGAFSFLMLKTRPRKMSGKLRLFRDIREGFQYTWETTAIRNGILLLTVAGLFIFPYSALLPIFTREILGGDALVFGYLAAAPAAGAILGGLYLAARKSSSGYERLIFIAGITASTLLILFSWSRITLLAGLILVFVGASLLLWTASINTFLQVTVDDSKRGRVMSFFTMSFMGSAPAGFLLCGFIAGLIGPAWTLSAGGFASLACVLFLRRKRTRQKEKLQKQAVKEGTG